MQSAVLTCQVENLHQGMGTAMGLFFVKISDRMYSIVSLLSIKLQILQLTSSSEDCTESLPTIYI